MDAEFDDLVGHDAGEEQTAALLATAHLLASSRPVPSAAFRGALRRHLMASSARPTRPARLRLLIASYAGAGSFLLAVAAWGAAGAGPLAA